MTEQMVAYRKVRTAIERGELIRPSCCSRCGKADAKAESGRHTIQAHHHMGYDRPLDVEWLCPKCHRRETPLPEVMGRPNFGVLNGTSKLTPAAVQEIHDSPLGCRRLAAKLGVDKKQIQRVRRGESWIAAAPTPPSVPGKGGGE